MLRMFARRTTQITIAAGTDEIIFGLSLPSGSVVHDIRAEVHCHFASNTPQNTIAMYAVEGYILPVLDPDAATGFEAIWDTLVPKDTDTEAIDLDTGAADATPFFEPGEPNFQGLYDVGLQPERIYRRSKMLTLAKGSVFSFRQQADDVIRWVPGDTFNIHVSRRLRINQPSVMVFGFASPTLDDHVTGAEAALAEEEWPQVKYAEEMLHRGLMHLMGLTETGAETPWVEAIALLKKHLEPDMREETSGSFVGSDWIVAARATIDHSVVGNLEKVQVSTQ